MNYVSQPCLLRNLNEGQSKTIIRLLDLTLDSGEVDSLFEILNEIIDLQPEERNELSKMLKLTSLSNIIQTITLIKGRLQAIENFKELVFKKELNANEVIHVQTMMEKNFWLVGEEYTMFASSEDTVKKVLEKFKKSLNDDYDDIKDLDEKDKYKQFDLLLSRQSITSNSIDNVLIELKHPNIKLGNKEYSQVVNYMGIIKKQEIFAAPNINWKFYLIGNKTDDYIKGQIQTCKNHGENSLVYNVDEGRCKIYIKTWSEIFADFEIKFNHLLDSLEIKKSKLIEKDFQSADEIIENYI